MPFPKYIVLAFSTSVYTQAAKERKNAKRAETIATTTAPKFLVWLRVPRLRTTKLWTEENENRKRSAERNANAGERERERERG